MKHPMRRADKQLSSKAALELLESGEVGIVSSVDADGQPYGVPVNYVVYQGCIDFHSATEGHKVKNFKANDRVSFCVVGKTKVLPEKLSTQYESVIVFGRISEKKGSQKSDSLRALVKKLAPDHIPAGEKAIKNSFKVTRVFSISIDSITGKAGE